MSLRAPVPSQPRKCVFFDRDGIVNEPPGAGYVERWADFRLLPEFVEALRTALRHGYVAVIVTNQRGVALGRMTRETVEEIHTNLRSQLRSMHGLDVLDIFYCPHDRDECECRKPKPGMLLAAAERHGIDVASSWMVGDNEKDVEAGRAAGCRTIFVGSGNPASGADHRVSTVGALAALFEQVL
jgi:D-glycero-D-manno-heptose 1,7-bisphosphate phosphatase